MKLPSMKSLTAFIVTAALLAAQPVEASALSQAASVTTIAPEGVADFCENEASSPPDSSVNGDAEEADNVAGEDSSASSEEALMTAQGQDGGNASLSDAPSASGSASGEEVPEEVIPEEVIPEEVPEDIPDNQAPSGGGNEGVPSENAGPNESDPSSPSGSLSGGPAIDEGEPAEEEEPVGMVSFGDEAGTGDTSEYDEEAADMTASDVVISDAAEPLNALSFRNDALIALFNAKMNVTDQNILTIHEKMGGSLGLISEKLKGQTAENVDAILRSIFAYMALDLTGTNPGFSYPEDILVYWNTLKVSIRSDLRKLGEGVVVTAVLPCVDVMSVTIDGSAIKVETEETFLIKAAGTSEPVLIYEFHSVFSFSDEHDTVILTSVQELCDTAKSGSDAAMSSMAAYNWTGGSFGVAENEMVEEAIQYGLAIAADQSHGYSQANRWGPDYDCSSFVITCFGHAGFNLGYYNWPNDTRHEQDLYYTGNLKGPFEDAGFEWIPASELGGMDSPDYLKRGDIVLREYHHTEIYIGNGYLLGAHGQVASASHPNRSAATGDQGDELSVIEYTNYYGKGYDGILRWPGASFTPAPEPDDPDDEDGSYDFAVGEYTIDTSMNVRSGPGKTYDVVSHLEEGELVYVQDVDGKWGKIADNQWVSLRYATYCASAKVDISQVKVTGLAKSYDYLNKAIKPSVKLTYDGVSLKKGTDYTITYSSNKVARTNAKITLTGIGSQFTGTRTLTFKIVPKVGTYKTTEAINLRASASESASVRIKIPTNAFVYVTSIKNVGTRYWAKTTYGGKSGWFLFGAATYISSADIADGMVTSGTISTSETYTLVSVSDAEYAMSAPSLGPGSCVRYYKVKRSSEKQRFTFKKSNAGGYHMVSCYTEQVVSPYNNKKAAGTALTLNPAGATAIKSWDVIGNSDGTFSFVNVSTKRAMQSENGKTQYKGRLVLAAQSSDTSQRFYLIRMPSVDHSFDGLYYIMKGKTTANYCMAVKGNSKVTGAKVILYKQTKAANKKFRLVYSGDGYYRILASDTGFALTLKDNASVKLTPLVMEEWKGYKSQRWKPVLNSDGTLCFVDEYGYAITLSGNKVANNTAIRSNTYKKTSYDKWVLKKA